MIEKIKDILYDLSDIMVSLAIIAVIFVSVSWKISDTLDVDLTDPLAKPTISSESSTPVTVIIPEIDSTGELNNIPTSTDPSGDDPQPAGDSDHSGDNNAPPADTSEPIDTSAPASDPVTNTDTATNPSAPQALNNFEVAEGSTGYSIGKKLASEGYVEDVNTFVNRLVALKLDNKLRAGTFKISKSDNLDTIIKVLAGQGRE